MRTLSRVCMVAVIGGAAAACGSDVVRFNDNPFSNPFGGSSRFDDKSQTTASVSQPAPTYGTPSPAVGQVSSAPLGAPSVASAPLPAPTALPSSLGPARNAASSAAAPAVSTAAAGWSAQGGTPVTLGQGETLKTLANRYGVPEAALRSANNLAGNAQPAAGQKVVIPVYNAVAAAPAAKAVVPVATAAPAKTPAAAPAAAQTAHANGKVAAAQPQTLQPPVGGKPVAPVAAAQPSKPMQVASVEPTKPDPKTAAKTAEPAKADAKAETKIDPKTGKPDPKAAKADAKAAPAAAPAAAAPETTAAIVPEKASASNEFRWPARGRVITGFGNKAGQQSDGINIAVPEGTPVKAAEGGTVGYAGNELKGYGNLVLIRHDNGYVTVYAHNGDLKVKRGEQVKRGQVIATSGQTGNVQSPQLRFEIRKGQTPVDPLEFLSGN